MLMKTQPEVSPTTVEHFSAFSGLTLDFTYSA